MNSELLDKIIEKLPPKVGRALADEIDGKINAAIKAAQDETVKAKAERVDWFKAGYDAGTSDDPTSARPSGRPFNLEERKVRAMAKYNMERNSNKK